MNAKVIDTVEIKKQFPIFSHRELIYLDSAATTQKPKRVIDKLQEFYSKDYATVHRAIYELSMEATDQYDAAREKVKNFINARSEEEIVFTRGATDAINLVKNSFGRAFVKKEDEILITEAEHHANIVPWQLLRDEVGCSLNVIPVCDDGSISLDEVKKRITTKTKLVSIAHVFNSTGVINPIAEIIEMAHAKGAYVLIDGAQSISRIPVDVQTLDCDFYVFSGHKAYGPTGVGVLYGKRELLEQMPPHQGGGDMIEEVTLESSTYQRPPLRFEAGTPMIAEAIGLREALQFLEEIGLDFIQKEEEELLHFTLDLLNEIDGLTIYGDTLEKTGIISFNVKDIHPLDLGTFLDLKNIAIRTGHHCAQPILKRFGVKASARISFGVYNTRSDVEIFINELKQVIRHLSLSI